MTLPLWVGCDAVAWCHLLISNGFAIHRSKWHIAAIASVVSLFHTALGCVQQAVYGSPRGFHAEAKGAGFRPRSLAIGHDPVA
jgi:hypothetical protein